MNVSKVSNFKAFINSIGGRFFTVDYIKKDGTIRTINGRTGVIKYLKGGVCGNQNIECLITYSIKDKGYRTINVDTITGIRANNMNIMVSDTLIAR